MTIKQAILEVLKIDKKPLTAMEVRQVIADKALGDWPSHSIEAALGNFERKGDSRVKRTKKEKKFVYYLSKYEEENENSSKRGYRERDLHKLLSSYLKKNENIYSKTILHEKSQNSKDEYQKWVHPDMIGVQFLKLKNKESNALLNISNRDSIFNLVSYEIKKEIQSDYELKRCFFQAVSNSSWANYGYLVAFKIDRGLIKEVERLNQSFGIGIIELNANPFESKQLFAAQYKALDFKTIDKLCEINVHFKDFIAKTEAFLTASDKYAGAVRQELERFCDNYFETNSDSEIKKYCQEKNIPFEEEDGE